MPQLAFSPSGKLSVSFLPDLECFLFGHQKNECGRWMRKMMKRKSFTFPPSRVIRGHSCSFPPWEAALRGGINGGCLTWTPHLSVCQLRKKKIIIGDLRYNKDNKNAEIKENQFPSVPKFGAKELIFEHIYDIFLFCSGGHTWQINHFEQNKHKNVPDRFLAARVM